MSYDMFRQRYPRVYDYAPRPITNRPVDKVRVEPLVRRIKPQKPDVIEGTVVDFDAIAEILKLLPPKQRLRIATAIAVAGVAIGLMPNTAQAQDNLFNCRKTYFGPVYTGCLCDVKPASGVGIGHQIIGGDCNMPNAGVQGGPQTDPNVGKTLYGESHTCIPSTDWSTGINGLVCGGVFYPNATNPPANFTVEQPQTMQIQRAPIIPPNNNVQNQPLQQPYMQTQQQAPAQVQQAIPGIERASKMKSCNLVTTDITTCTCTDGSGIFAESQDTCNAYRALHP